MIFLFVYIYISKYFYNILKYFFHIVILYINVVAKNLIMKILKSDPKQRLPLEEMMKHPFITKFTPDAAKHLIKPVEGLNMSLLL